MLNTKNRSVPSLSRPPLLPLKLYPHSLSSTDNNLIQTHSKLNDTTSPCQMLYQTHTAPDTGPSLSLLSSSSTLNPMNPSSVITQNHTVPFVAMNKSVKIFDGPGHQNPPGNLLHQIDSHIIFLLEEQSFSPVAYNQGQERKLAKLKCCFP